ncbi:hypothetical protein [Xylophilus sp. Leaf220]|uniref:hypothetical protein n=1 Tax=Xylophilus sp. Leaf220 TaxID=1735686 RepID=UPI0012E267F2|nr:hypothetical protein [Xylophilus sp. Leaf220]
MISNLANDSLVYPTPGTTARLDVGSDALFSGIPGSQLVNGEIRVRIATGASASDTLGIAYDPSYAVGTANLYSPGLIYVNTGVGGYRFGTVAGGGAGSDLVVTYWSSFPGQLDPVAATQIILRSLTFRTTAPGTPDRTFSVTVTDSNGDTTVPVVFGVNHAFAVAPAAPVVHSVPGVEGSASLLLGAAILAMAFMKLRRRR